MKLNRIVPIKGEILLQSGLHIGAGDTEMHIGGTDNPVVTHPHTGEPYIPGSSLKGKVRSLLEMRSGLMGKTNGKPMRFKDLSGLTGDEREHALSILQLFGTSGADGEEARKVGQTRASFADCFLTDYWQQSNDKPFTEIKAETAINRIQGTAETGSLRFTERVVAGLTFDFTITIKEMEGDTDLLGLLLEGLKMLEYDALGGNGSRGYGRVSFEFTEPEIQSRFSVISF